MKRLQVLAKVKLNYGYKIVIPNSIGDLDSLIEVELKIPAFAGMTKKAVIPDLIGDLERYF